MPMNEPHRLLVAFWINRFDGVFTLSRDWDSKASPPVALAQGGQLTRVGRMEPTMWARFSGYFFENGKPVFLLWPELYPNYDWRNDPPCVAGEFNQWKTDERWELKPETWKGGVVLVLRADPSKDWIGPIGCDFKFVTKNGIWLEVPNQAYNRRSDGKGHFNYYLNPDRTGKHVFRFVTDTPTELGEHHALVWTDERNRHAVEIGDGDFLLQRMSPVELGVRVEKAGVRFRLFAPRARDVVVETWPPEDDGLKKHQLVPLAAHGDGVWEATVRNVCHGWRYQFFIAGKNVDTSSAFDGTIPVLDPYALAAMGPTGPGLVIDLNKLSHPKNNYMAPAPTDLVIAEAHVRDLVAHLPHSGTRPGFRELAAWVRSPDCYLKHLGVNAVELQPVQEFDAKHPEHYHWGYMTNAYFAPASAYASDAAAGSQLEDFRDLVEAFHEAGIAVILDVVYNHVGEPNHLLRIDKTYYLETSHEGELTNWSGCGNDVRASAPMVRRLIIDSLKHLVMQFGVDGFRFDLAELIGMPVLHEIECELRAIKPDVILIAEPWSLRGHIGKALRATSYASWNDAYREFLPHYVYAACASDGLCYFLSGSLDDSATAPTHTLNYTESHDDMCWLDRITENRMHNGTKPTANDERRTRMMASLLLASLGVPMFSAGQDFLRSKGGARNTYLRGDINALDYARLEEFRDTHEFFRAWIAFRLSPEGAVFRWSKKPGAGFFRFFQQTHTNALAVWYNADGAAPVPSLFFAVNPHLHPMALDVPGVDPGGFRQIANGEKLLPEGLPVEEAYAWKRGLLALPALSTGLWVVKE